MIPKTFHLSTASTAMTAGVLSLVGTMASADQVFLDDIIVDGSACIGQDCSNGESFGFDTIRLKENNLRIKFDDTSVSASFPRNDWQLTANETSNGGQNKFSIDDITGGRTPFTIEAAAPTDSLYVDDGRLGFGTDTPVVNLHVKEGNTPTLRLEQDGSSGFTAQTWDVAGNEANFFVRDATNGSKLVFRVKPGAPDASIYIDADGDIGMGTTSPDADMEISTSESFVFTRLTALGGSNPNDSADITYTSGSANTGEIRYNIVDGDNQEMALSADGVLSLSGTCINFNTQAGSGGDFSCTFADTGVTCSASSC
jgi:hypothetical protein